MGVNTSELDSRIFEGFAETSKRRYIYVCNMQTNISRWSRHAVEYFGLPGEYIENAGDIWADFIHPEDREMYLSDIKDIFSGKKSRHDLDYRVRNKEGEYVFCTCRGVVSKGQNGAADLFLGSIENHGIMDNVDAATNLYNIYEFWQNLGKLRAKKTDVFVLMLGIVGFSEINDIYGYSFGDRVLRELGKVLLDLTKGYGTLFRMDGVRFACNFVNQTKEQIQEVFEKMRHAASHNVFVDGVRVSLVLSGGAVFADESYDEYTVLGSARYALQQSRHEKHGELVFFDNELRGSNRKNLELMRELRKSILNGCEGFYLCFQPIISAEGERLIGAEALLRWNKEPFGEVAPGKFVPWLEGDPTFFELGKWILREALKEGKVFLEKYPDFVLNVNVAYTQLSRMEFRKSVEEILEETGYPAKNLCLELTERCRQLEKGYLRREIDYLRTLGVKIAIDDFGTGFSSLNLLSELPVDTLKIDRGFISDIQTNRANQKIVKAISSCAQDLGVHVCLEGLEDRNMIDFTKQFAVYSYQGFYFSRPITRESFIEKYC